MWPTTLFQFRGVALDPTVDRGMIDMQTTFQHDFFEISITQCIPQIPPDTQQNNLSLEMTPFERMLLCHDWSSCFFSPF
jgi:hypothetical protein